MAFDVETRYDGELPRRTATEAAETIADDATILVSGFGSVGYPKAVPTALSNSGRDLGLTIVSGGSVGPEIDTALVKSGMIDRRFPYQGQPEMRKAVNSGRVAFQDRNVSAVGDEVRFGRLVDADVAIVEAIAVGEDWLIPSTSIGQTPAFVESVDRLIVELNHAQPLSLQQIHDNYVREIPPNRKPIPLTSVDGRIGSPKISFEPESLEAVVETDMLDSPYQFRDPTGIDETIASNLVSFLNAEIERCPVFDEQVNIQFGVGSLGNALMSRLKELDIGDRNLAYFGEVIQDGLLRMLDSGVVQSASAASLALSTDGQEELFEHIEAYMDSVVLRPASISNNPALIDQFGVIAVNSALEVDVYGHINSTHVNGRKMMNGVGGSGDYGRNSMLAVIALPSTAKDGAVSRVVPMVPHVDHTEHDIQVIVTEQGVADLRGLSPKERAKTIVENCAHPAFREKLSTYLNHASTKGGHIHHVIERAVNWNS